ncbi:MAG: aldo/keto reductase [Nitrososphaerota archaeon]|nr:aldo/keto reductase [Nitrososphaerota archaeon]
MILKEFAKTGKKISAIGLGTYYDPAWIASGFLGWRRGAETKVEAIKAGLDAGITLVDTAEVYRSEPLVAKAIAGRDREDIFVATKVLPNHLSKDRLTKAFHRSLARLGTTYIDLYQVHWPNSRVPIQETMSAMEKLVEDGKLRYIGVSNFTLERIKEAQSALRKAELSSVQLDYSLVNRKVEEAILPYCDSQGIALLAYYPLGHGKLPSDARLDHVIGGKARTRAQVALQWLAGKPSVFPIPRASQKEHVRDNAEAGSWELTESERAYLDVQFR